MELNNFGSIMKFAIDRENDVKALLEGALRGKNISSISGRLGELSEQNRSNLKILIRTRQEGICEMVLHPITGLNAGDYIFPSTLPENVSETEIRSAIEDAGSRISKFYSDASEKLPADDAKRAFSKLAKKKYII